MHYIEAASTAMDEVMMKVPKVQENKEMDYDQMVQWGKYQYFTDAETC